MKKFLYLLCIGMLCAAPIAQAKCSPCDEKTSCKTNCFDCTSNDRCKCAVTSKSFLSIRPFFTAASPAKLALVHEEIQELQTQNGNLFQIVPFGGRTRDEEGLAWYFGPSCKRILTVSSDPDSNPDIIAQNLGIYAQDGETFESTFCLSPQQTFAGLGLNYRTHFGCGDENKGFFLDVTLPVYYVKNLVNLCEQVSSDGGAPLIDGSPANVTEAMKQSSWCAGRIDDCSDTTETGVSELDVQIGYGWGREKAHMHSYVGVILPTGNKVTGRKLFEPIIGWNHNTAVHFGSTFGIHLWQDECNDRSLWYEMAIDSRYFFENTQCRSFDLKCKPWSRYMQIYENQAQAQEAADLCDPISTAAGQTLGSPGINLLTQAVRVLPRYQRTYNTAFALDLKCWTLEAGYNFFTRDAECVRLECPWDQIAGVTKTRQNDGTYVATDGPALKALQGCGFTNSLQTIDNATDVCNDLPVADYANNIITEKDLDLSSAEAPCMLSNRFYGAIGYSLDRCGIHMLIGLGGSYEFSSDNSGIERVGGWGKLAFIF